MKLNFSFWVLFLVFGTFINVSSVTEVYGAQDDIVFISHSNAKDSSLTVDQVISIYLGRKSKWSDGTSVVPIQFGETNAATKVLLKDFLDFKPKEYKEYWRKQLFAGRLLPPVRVQENEEMLKMVSSELGAFGFLAKEDASEAVIKKSKVKTIQITK